MNRILILLLLFVLLINIPVSFSEETKVFTAGISLEKVPNEFYGTWRVSSTLVNSNSEIFRKKNTDLWNLSRHANVIILENPFSSAKASITISELSNNFIKFKKTGYYNGKKLTDSVELNLKKESFTGFNELKLDTTSDADGHVIKTEKATYKLVGEKISGTSINQ